MQRRVKIQRDSQGQFVEIPPGYEPSGDDFIMRKDGDVLIIEPTSASKHSLLKLRETLKPLDKQ